MPQYVFHFNEDGSVLYKEAHKTSPYPDIATDPLVWVTTDESIGELDQNSISATFENGQVVGVNVVPPPGNIFLHVALSGGDGDPDVLGVNLDGSNPIHVVATLREGSDSASPVVDAVSGTWRVHLRDLAGGIYDIVQVTMTAGVAELDYTPAANLRPALVHMEEADLIRVEGYNVRLANPVEMKIYRTLAA